LAGIYKARSYREVTIIMSMFKNKHLLVATLMAPILGLIGYFGINALVAEKPLVAEAGQSYLLVEKPNCRYASGICGLKNMDFELVLRYEQLENGRMLLKLESENPLDGVMLALAESGADEEPPVEMRPVGVDGLNWTLDVKQLDPNRHRLHVVASSNQTLYYGDAATKFTLTENTDGQ
jgi:hypothetical protein